MYASLGPNNLPTVPTRGEFVIHRANTLIREDKVRGERIKAKTKNKLGCVRHLRHGSDLKRK